MDRRIARAHAMKLIYEWEMGGVGGDETKMNLLEVQPGEDEEDFMNRMSAGVLENAESLDAEIAKYLHGWTIDRLSKVDLAILRLAAYELRVGEVAPGVVINEAVELANRYSSEKSGAFINGVLGSMHRAQAEA